MRIHSRLVSVAALITAGFCAHPARAQEIAQPPIDRIKLRLFRDGNGGAIQVIQGGGPPDVRQREAEAEARQKIGLFAALRADNIDAAGAAKIGFRVEAADWEFDDLIFGRQTTAAAVRGRLVATLQQKLADFAALCELSEAQRVKLEVAGRGDIQRLFDRIEDLRTECSRSQEDAIRAMASRGAELQSSIGSQLFGDSSLLAKLVRRMLSDEQIANWDALCELERMGGKLSLRTRGTEVVTEVLLTASRANDRNVAGLAGMSGLVVLGLCATRVTDAGLAELRGLQKLESLDLSSTRVTGEGLLLLAELSRLRTLDLSGSRLTDDGLEHVARFTGLVSLQIDQTRITDAGLAHLSELRELQRLNLAWTRVTDAGLVNMRLKEFRRLKELDLNGTAITDAGVAELRGLVTLESLSLSGTRITDAALADVAHLNDLKQLFLGRTEITDAGLRQLAKLTSLKQLYVSGTGVTEEGIAELQRGLPEVEVRR
jgi:hypothetical protein